jgi:hypothetical protein
VGTQQYYGQFPTASATSVTQPAGAGASSGAGTAWTNPGGITTPGGVATIALPSSSSAQFLFATAFGFSIPAGATITGVQVTMTKANDGTAGARKPTDNQIQLSVGGAPSGTNHAQPGQWPSPPDQFVYGGPGDLWGLTLAPADVNAPGFGFALQVAPNGAFTYTPGQVFGQIVMTVYYSTFEAVNGFTLSDATSNPNVSQWTQGATATVTLPFQPGLMNPWRILGWSISYQGFLRKPVAGVPSFGLLGQLWGGLMMSGVPRTTQAQLNPWVNPLQGFPNDLAAFGVIWDGSQATPFPWLSSAQPLNPRSITFYLPVPIDMEPGDAATMGLWLTPSLVQNTLIAIANPRYTITYDDNVSRTGTPTQ